MWKPCGDHVEGDLRRHRWIGVYSQRRKSPVKNQVGLDTARHPGDIVDVRIGGPGLYVLAYTSVAYTSVGST